MMRLHAGNRTAAWLALAGMALNAFWPLLASAKPNVPALPSEICSATGLKHAPADAPSRDTQPTHCKLCPFNAERGPAISGAALALVCPMSGCEQVQAFFSERQLQAAFDPAAPPRAPPFST